MFCNDLYTINSFSGRNGNAEAHITINASHKIFEGHFPAQPVLPGVCMMQIVKELSEKATSKNLFMHQVDQCKFLSPIDPLQTPQLYITIQYNANLENEIEAQALIKSGEAVFFKMKSRFRII